jgi:sugar lactone lactonase YvrE
VGVRARVVALASISALAGVLTVAPGAGAAAPSAGPGRSDLPSTYVVSTAQGVLPEGIEVTPAGRILVTSSATGDIFVGSVGSPTMQTLASGAAQGRTSALGVHTDPRGRIFVASVSGIDVLRADGSLLARRAVPQDHAATAYLNDLVITHDAVYVTDSNEALVWRAPLLGNEIGDLEPWLDANALMPDFQPGWFYLNGIAASPDGQRLLVSAQGLGALIRVDVASRDASFVDMDGSVFGNFGPDGMLLRGDVVRGVLNYGAPEAGQGLYAARLSDDWRSGTVVTHDTTAAFSSPTTVARSGDRYLVVNSQLDTAPGTPPYTVVAVPDPLG